MIQEETILHLSEKAAIQGAITSAASCLYYGTNALARIPYFKDVRLCYVAFGVGAVTSLVNDYVHKFVKDEIHIKNKAQDQASLMLGAGLGAVMYHISLSVLNPALARDTGMYMNGAIGAGSELSGSFVYNLIRGN